VEPQVLDERPPVQAEGPQAELSELPEPLPVLPTVEGLMNSFII